MSRTEKLRIAVVGAGSIGKTHIELVKKLAALDAVVDPSAAAERFAQEAGAKWFSHLENYLSAQRPHGAIIATPNTLHAEQGMRCLEAGIPILVEKPISDDAQSAAALISLSKQKNIPVLVGHHRRHSEVAKKVKSFIDSGNLGKLVSVSSTFLVKKPKKYFDEAWRTKAGAGPVFINLIHDIDLLQHFCGPIVGVQAMLSNKTRGFEAMDSGAAVLEFKNGVIGTATFSDAVPSPWSWELTSGEDPTYPKSDESCYLLGGTEGALSVPNTEIWSHDGPDGWWSPIQKSSLNSLPINPLVSQLQHFLEVIEGNAAPLVSAADGLRNVHVLDALLKSAASAAYTQVTPLSD